LAGFCDIIQNHADMPIIRLSDTDTQAFQEQYFIQEGAKKKFVALLKRFIESQNSYTDFKSDQDRGDCKSQSPCVEASRVHNTILVNGARGQGKTSFILSILEQEAELLNTVCNLCIIDPTMIETKEHIFLNIIAQINERVDEYRTNERYVSEECYKGWKRALMNLAAGLNVLDGVGSEQLKDALWDSPELILEKGLTNSKQGSKLEHHFHAFLKESLKLLDKKVFLLVLDDIDTSLSQGKAILETLRKYLTSKQLIIVMLGDIDLYATIVRQLQWEKMDPNETLYKYESVCNKEKDCKEVNDFYRSQIEHLEEQYLTKILKPENRIKLETILELKKKLKVQQCDNDDLQPLSDFLANLVERVFLTSKQSRYAKLYEQTLLVQSTRSVVQVLKAGADCGVINSNPNEQEQTDRIAFAEALRQVFFTTLQKKLESFDFLDMTKKETWLNRLSVYMIKSEINRDSHMKLLPEYRDGDKNIAMLFLNAANNAQLEPQHYLSYLIKVGYALDRFGSIGDATHSEKFIDHVGLDSDISNAHVAKRLLTTFKVPKNPIFFGNVFLSGEDLKKITRRENMALFMSRVFYPKGGHYTFLSLFNLLGFLADLAGAENPKSLQELLEDSSLIRDFHAYDSGSGSSSSEEISDDLEFETLSFDIENRLENELSKWASDVSKINQYLSAADLANIWIRLSYTLNGIDGFSKNKSKTYTERLSLYRDALLNAVYICCEEKKDTTPDIKNPVTDPDYFDKKIKEYKRKDGEYTLFDYLRECPALKSNIITLPEDLKGTRSLKDFRNLSEEDKIDAITSISKWDSKEPKFIKDKLQEGYTNVNIRTITALIKKAKPSL